MKKFETKKMNAFVTNMINEKQLLKVKGGGNKNNETIGGIL